MTTVARFSLLAVLVLMVGFATSGRVLAQADGDNDAPTPDAEADAPAAAEPAAAEDAESAEEEATDDPERIEFGRPQIEPQTTFTAVRLTNSDLSLHLSYDDQSFQNIQRVQSTNVRTGITVLDVADGRPTAAEFRILTRSDVRSTQGGIERHSESPLVGERFVARLTTDGEIAVTTGDGEGVNDETAAVVRAEMQALRSGAPLSHFLAERRPRFGDEISIEPALAAGLFPGLSHLTLEDVTLRAREFEMRGDEPQRHVVFGITARLSGAAVENLPTTLALEGTLIVRQADGWITQMTVEGPMQVEAEQTHGERTLRLVGRGTYRLELSN